MGHAREETRIRPGARPNHESDGRSLGRRRFLTTGASALAAAQLNRTVAASPQDESSVRKPSIRTREGESVPRRMEPLDRQIWEEELSDFVPTRIFDAHCHIYRADFDLNYRTALARKEDFKTETVWTDCDIDTVRQVESVLMPGRQITRLAFPFPFYRCDFRKSNEFAGREIRKEPGSAALMLVEPSISAHEVEETVLKHRLLGLKPYARYCTTPECRITDFLPEHQIAVADRYGLLIMLHVGMKNSFADPRNVSDMLRLADRYPRAQWILAHGARSFSPYPIEKAAPAFRGLPNVWYEVSAVCSMESFDVLFSQVDTDRILYGADSGDVAFSRGKIVFYGSSWGDLTSTANQLGGELTFYLYEQLRAMRRAAIRLGLTRKQIQDIFFTTGDRLVQSVTASMRDKFL